jgi:6-phosphofructokinase 2
MTSIVTVTLNPAVDISAEIQELVPSEKLRCYHVVTELGGGGINVSRVISELNGSSKSIVALGGPTGAHFAQLMKDDDFDMRIVQIRGMTRQSISITDSATNSQYRFVLPGPEFVNDEWENAFNLITEAMSSANYIILSGSLPPGVPTEIFGDIARVAGMAKVVVDSSDESLAEALRVGVYLAKPNLAELRRLAGRPLDGSGEVEAYARDVVSNGWTEILAVSMGQRGALLTTRDTQVLVPAPEIAPRSSVGAGDSFVGAMVLSLSRGQDPIDACRYGVAAGAAALLTPGSQLCKREDVERLYETMIAYVK